MPLDIFNVGFIGSLVKGLSRTLSDMYYDSKLFNFTEMAEPRGLDFSTDGSYMYICGQTNNKIYQYELSTPWDVSTASYTSNYFDIDAQETDVTGVKLKPDGTKMYIIGDQNEDIFQYSLSSAWDVSTASYDSKSLNTSSQVTGASALFFNTDGTIFYAVDNYPTNAVYQYTLTSAWDVSTGSYASKSLTLEPLGTDGNPQAISITSDGKALIMLDNVSDALYQYTLGTAWDVSTGSYDSDSFSTTSQTSDARGMAGNSSLSLLYLCSKDGTKVYQYVLPSYVEE